MKKSVPGFMGQRRPQSALIDLCFTLVERTRYDNLLYAAFSESRKLKYPLRNGFVLRRDAKVLFDKAINSNSLGLGRVQTRLL